MKSRTATVGYSMTASSPTSDTISYIVNHKTRVLLTGAGGFMGAHVLIHFLHNTDWELVLIDSFRHRGKTDRINEVLKEHPEYKERITVITHDLRAPFSAQMVHKLGKLDYIVSIASESHVDRSIEEPRDFIENNVQLILSLLEYAKENPVKKFLHISTDEVYGPAPKGHAHKEGEAYRPSNPYSASKAAQEVICYAYWRTYGVPVAISNTMNIIGEMQDTEKFVPKVIKHVQSGETMPIHASKEGEIGTRFYLHARNQADALMFLLKNVDFPKYGKAYETYNYQDVIDPEAMKEYGIEPIIKYVEDIGRFNIVGEREVTNLEMAQMIAEYSGKPLNYELVDFHSSRPGHDLRYALDGTKIASLGWVPPLSLEESLKNTVEWFLEHKEWSI